MQRRRPRQTPVACSADVADVVDAASYKPTAAKIKLSSLCQQHPDHPTDDDQQQQQSPMAPINSDAELQVEGILFFVGDALLDVYADVSREFLESNHLQFGRAIVATDMHEGHLTLPHRDIIYGYILESIWLFSCKVTKNRAH